MVGLIGALKGKRNADVPMTILLRHLFIALLPVLAAVLLMGSIYLSVTAPTVVDTTGLQEMGAMDTTDIAEPEAGGLQEPEGAEGLQAPPTESYQETPNQSGTIAVIPQQPAETPFADSAPAERRPAPLNYWISLRICPVGLVIFCAIFNFVQLEIFKMLSWIFFPAGAPYLSGSSDPSLWGSQHQPRQRRWDHSEGCFWQLPMGDLT